MAPSSRPYTRPLLDVRAIADYFKSQSTFPPILEVSRETVKLWMAALNLGASRNNIRRRCGPVLNFLRDEAQPPVTRQECQDYQAANGANLDAPVFLQLPAPNSLGGVAANPQAARRSAADRSRNAAARDAQAELQLHEYDDHLDHAEHHESDPEEEARVKNEAKKAKKKARKEKEAQEARDAQEAIEAKRARKEKRRKEKEAEQRDKEVRDAQEAIQAKQARKEERRKKKLKEARREARREVRRQARRQARQEKKPEEAQGDDDRWKNATHEEILSWF
jgi:hypothetical protein